MDAFEALQLLRSIEKKMTKAEGAIEALLQELQRVHGVSTLAAAEELLASLDLELAAAKQKLERQRKLFSTKWDKWIEERLA